MGVLGSGSGDQEHFVDETLDGGCGGLDESTHFVWYSEMLEGTLWPSGRSRELY